MLEVLSRFCCCLAMCVAAFFIIKKITNSNERLFTLRNTTLILILTTVHTIIYNTTYNISSVLIIFIINLLFHKIIFKLSLEEAMISCCFYTIILFLSDAFGTIFMTLRYSIEEIKKDLILSVVSNVTVGIISVTIININIVYEKCIVFYNSFKTRKQTIDTIFLFLIIILFVFLGYNVGSEQAHSIEIIINISIMIIMAIIAYIFIKSKIRYSQLSDEYNTLFGYVQNFEEWIERDQLNRHEYKNQLAVIRSITKDKSVIKKINDLLDDNIKIKGDAVYKLKELPTGGLKGLMYYKVAIAQKQNINIEVDVSLKRKSKFKKLNEHKTKVLSNLIGIYFDNAIEAALETEEKNVCLEVYEIKDGVKFVISNTFKRSENFDRRNERGVTSKGKGHGNGLYYANNLISKNNWIDASQEIIDNYYIQNIIIKN